VFAFDIFNPNVRLLARASGERHFVMRAESPAYGELTVDGTTEYDAATQVNHARWIISAPGRTDAWTVDIDFRNVFPLELEALLASGGLRLESRRGDFTGGPFASSSSRQVCVCVPA
jgi:hypothetical protein